MELKQLYLKYVEGDEEKKMNSNKEINIQFRTSKNENKNSNNV